MINKIIDKFVKISRKHNLLNANESRIFNANELSFEDMVALLA